MGIFAGKIIAGQNLIEHFPIDAATEIGDRHMYVVHGNQDQRVRVHHGEQMCDEALENGNESNISCWFKDSIIRYDVGEGMENDAHQTIMLTDTDEYETRIVDFFTQSLM